MSSFLGAILHPISREKFVRSFPNEPYVDHGDPSRLAPLLDLPELRSVSALAAAFHAPVTAWFDDDTKFGEPNATPLRAPESLPRYEAGALLQFNDIQQWVPALCPLLRSLEDDLDLPHGAARSQLFASKSGSGAKAHWDNDPVLTVQLRGTKRWRFAPQSYVEEPLHNFVCGGSRAQFAGYYDGPLPERMPDDARDVLLQPGSVLFLPRSYMHETRSQEHSLSIAFDFNIPTWLDVVSKHIQRELMKRVPWRRFALGLVREDLSRPAHELSSMIGDLEAIVADLAREPMRAIQGLEEPLVPGAAGRDFRRTSARAELHREQVDGLDVWRIDVSRPQAAPVQLEISPDFVPFVRWLLGARGAVTARQVFQHAASLEPVDLSSVLSALVEVGALEVVT